MGNTVRNIIIGGGVVALGIYLKRLWNIKNASDNIKYQIINVGKPTITGGQLKLDVVLAFTNPTNQPVDLETIFLDVSFANGTPLASVTKTNFGVIQPNNRTYITLPIETGNLTFLSVMNLINLIRNGAQGYKTLFIKGNYRAEGFLQTIEENIDLF